MEAVIACACAEGSIPGTVIRAGDSFDGGTGSWPDLVIARALRRSRLVCPGPMGIAHAWAHLPDRAQAFVAVADRSVAGFRALHFSGHTLTGAELRVGLEHAGAGGSHGRVGMTMAPPVDDPASMRSTSPGCRAFANGRSLVSEPVSSEQASNAALRIPFSRFARHHPPHWRIA